MTNIKLSNYNINERDFQQHQTLNTKSQFIVEEVTSASGNKGTTVNNKNFTFTADGTIVAGNHVVLSQLQDGEWIGIGNQDINGKYVITGNPNGSYYSLDGITWTTTSTLPASGNEIIYAGGKFVCINSTSAYYSTDGETWHTTNTFPSGNIKNILNYNDNIFVAGHTDSGANTTIYYSTDGITWHASNLITTTWVPNKIIYGNNKFVIIGSYGSYYSLDGKIWNACSNPLDTSAGGYNYLLYDNNIFVASFTFQSGSGFGLIYSYDGITWSTAISVVPSTGYDVLYLKDKFFATDFYNSFYSIDGVNWISSSHVFFSPRLANTMFFAQDHSRTLYYSYDGITWNTTNGIPSGFNNLTYVLYGNNTYVAIIDNVGIYYSTDGINWSHNTSNLTINSSQIRNAYFLNNSFFICSDFNLWFSPDGNIWSEQLSPLVISDTLFYNNNRYVTFLSANYSENAGSFYSNDGINWIKSTTFPDHYNLYGIIYD